jgi:hypothetical protein
MIVPATADCSLVAGLGACAEKCRTAEWAREDEMVVARLMVFELVWFDFASSTSLSEDSDRKTVHWEQRRCLVDRKGCGWMCLRIYKQEDTAQATRLA